LARLTRANAGLGESPPAAALAAAAK
jgi:hypothetical protein